MKLLEVAGCACKVLASAFRATLQQAIEANHERAKANGGTKEPQPEMVVRAKIEFPIGFEKEYRAGQRAQQKRDRLRIALEGLTLVAVAAYAWVSYGQWNETRKQATIAAADLRPWIKIRSIGVGHRHGPIKALMFHWPTTGARMPPFLQYTVTIENVGHSVAQKVTVLPELFFANVTSEKSADIISNEQTRFCGSTEPGRGVVIYPSDSFVWPGGVGATLQTQDSVATLILCVDYIDAAGTRYQTQTRAQLSENGKNLVRAGVDADADVLRLDRDIGGDTAN